MNDPTNWNIAPSIKSIEVENPAMAKEMAKRWDAYPGLILRLRKAREILSQNMFISDGEEEDNNYEVQAEMREIEATLLALGE